MPPEPKSLGSLTADSFAWAILLFIAFLMFGGDAVSFVLDCLRAIGFE